MASTVTKGRSREQGILDLLGMYQAATTEHIAALHYGGNQIMARRHLLALYKQGHLERYPHPTRRGGGWVYTRGDRSTGHSQKILHHLSEMDFHVAVMRHLGPSGTRVIAELPWGAGLVPDQTVLLKNAVWAVEHHLSGRFGHLEDYRRFMEETAFKDCHWWRVGIHLGLLILTAGTMLDRVKAEVGRRPVEGLRVRVTTVPLAQEQPAVCLGIPLPPNMAAATG